MVVWVFTICYSKDIITSDEFLVRSTHLTKIDFDRIIYKGVIWK